MTAFAQNGLKIDGKFFGPGDEVSKSDAGDAFDHLMEIGAIGDSPPEFPGEEAPAFEEMTVPQLRAQASAMGVEGTSSMNKAELLSAIAEAQEG